MEYWLSQVLCERTGGGLCLEGLERWEEVHLQECGGWASRGQAYLASVAVSLAGECPGEPWVGSIWSQALGHSLQHMEVRDLPCVPPRLWIQGGGLYLDPIWGAGTAQPCHSGLMTGCQGNLFQGGSCTSKPIWNNPIRFLEPKLNSKPSLLPLVFHPVIPPNTSSGQRGAGARKPSQGSPSCCFPCLLCFSFPGI